MKYFSNGIEYLTTPGHKAGHQMELIRPGNSPRHFFGACASSGPLYKQDCIAFNHVVPAHTLVRDPGCKSSPPLDVGNWSFTLT